MPVTSTPDHKLRIVLTICSGLVTLEEVEHYQKITWSVPGIYSYNELFDFSDSDISNISCGDLLTIAERASKAYTLDPDSRFAFLTSTQDHQRIADFYIAAKAITKGPSREIRSFTPLDLAMAWLTENHRGI